MLTQFYFQITFMHGMIKPANYLETLTVILILMSSSFDSVMYFILMCVLLLVWVSPRLHGLTLKVSILYYSILFDFHSMLPFLKFQIIQNSFPAPTSQHVSETQLDHYTREYLQRLVHHKVVVSGWVFLHK